MWRCHKMNSPQNSRTRKTSENIDTFVSDYFVPSSILWHRHKTTFPTFCFRLLWLFRLSVSDFFDYVRLSLSDFFDYVRLSVVDFFKTVRLYCPTIYVSVRLSCHGLPTCSCPHPRRIPSQNVPSCTHHGLP